GQDRRDRSRRDARSAQWAYPQLVPSRTHSRARYDDGPGSIYHDCIPGPSPGVTPLMSARPGFRQDQRPEPRVEQLRMPPQSVDAEQAVLGGLMLAPDAFDRIADLLNDKDFYRRDHQLIYRAIRELAEKDKPFDAVTLGEWFESNGLSEQVAGGAYLVELASTTPSAANIKAYAEIVRDKAVLRQLIEIGTDIVNDGFQPEGRDSAEILA